ncbi:hypothetical protein LTR95_015115 [Oleoguttula sp. CCFEE 5521]
MAGGFSFPPPPPPPPKRTPAPLPLNSDYQSQQRGRGGGRGGRDDSNSRGRDVIAPGPGYVSAPSVGGSNFIPLGVRGRGGGSGNGPPSRETATPAGHGPSPARYASDGNQRSPSSIPNLLPSFAGLPSGAHVNPRFLNQNGTANVAMAQNPDTRNYLPDARSSSRDGPNSLRRGQPSLSHPDRTHAGHKRKLDALRGSPPLREELPSVLAAPAVPSFYAIPTASTIAKPPVRHGSRSATSGSHSTKIAPTSLGLIPRIDEDYDEPGESDDDNPEDIDEEAQYAELGARLTFEHNGEVMSLNNAADLAAWREARRKAFPTTTRVADREDDRRQTGKERRRLLADMHLLWRDVRIDDRKLGRKADGARKDAPADKVSVQTPGSRLQQATRRFSECTKELESIQRSSTNSEEQHRKLLDLYGVGGTESHQSPPPELLATLGDVTAIEAVDNAGHNAVGDDVQDSASVSVSSSKVSSDNSSSESDTDDEPPEITSSKPKARPDHVKGLCRYFAASDYCRDGDACRFRHELSAKANAAFRAAPQVSRPVVDRFAPKLDKPATNGRKSIHERLVQQEQEEEDRLMLKAIKALGQVGLFAQSNAA